MKVSLIVAVYKDVAALKVIIHSLRAQTDPDFEVIVAEDGQDAAMRQYIEGEMVRDGLDIRHVSHEDCGWRKNKILNQALVAARGEYLIFIDGDCVPYHHFIENHKRLITANVVRCGRRSEPGAVFSRALREQTLSIVDFDRQYLRHYFRLRRDGVRHYEEGIYAPPNSWARRWAQMKANRKAAHLLGCHWACHKTDLLKINGFDEDFQLPTTGEDTDIERRLRHFGVGFRSCRNLALVVHLDHPKNFNAEMSVQTQALMASKADEFVCRNGIHKTGADET